MPQEGNETLLHSQSYQEEQKDKVRRHVEEPVGSGLAGTKGKTIYLFNCDNLCNLSEVESLMKAVENKIVKHPFGGGQIANEVEKTIPSLKNMDYAVFVVHAHESSLSFNEDSGYGKIYRALKKQAGSSKIIDSDYVLFQTLLRLKRIYCWICVTISLCHPTEM